MHILYIYIYVKKAYVQYTYNTFRGKTRLAKNHIYELVMPQLFFVNILKLHFYFHFSTLLDLFQYFPLSQLSDKLWSLKKVIKLFLNH